MDLAALKAALSSVANTMAFSAKDWSKNRGDAWIYGIVLGWDCDSDHEQHDDECNAMSEVAERHEWTKYDVERLREHHRNFAALEEQR